MFQAAVRMTPLNGIAKIGSMTNRYFEQTSDISNWFRCHCFALNTYHFMLTCFGYYYFNDPTISMVGNNPHWIWKEACVGVYYLDK